MGQRLYSCIIGSIWILAVWANFNGSVNVLLHKYSCLIETLSLQRLQPYNVEGECIMNDMQPPLLYKFYWRLSLPRQSFVDSKIIAAS